MLDGKYLFLINAKTEPQSFYLPKGKWKKIAENWKIAWFNKCDVSGIAFEVLEHMDDKNDGVCYEKVILINMNWLKIL